MNLANKILLTLVNFLLTPVHIIVFLLLFMYKCVVLLVAKIFQNFVQPIPGSSSLFLADHIWTNPHSSIVCGLELEGDVNVESVAATFQKIYDIKNEGGEMAYKEMGYYPVKYFGFGFWKECPNFKICSRVHVLNENMERNEEPLVSLIEKMLRQPYKLEDPLWDVYLLHNYSGKAHRTLVIFRFHHLLADGVSLVKLIYAGFGYSKLPENFTKPSTSFSKWDALSKSNFVKLATVASLLTTGFVEYLDEILISQDKNRINFDSSGKLKVAGNWICSFGKKLDIAEMKKASKYYNCSITHIFLAGMSGALEKYFLKYCGDTETPGNVHFVASIPIPKHPDLRLINHWALCRTKVKLGTPKIPEKINLLKEEFRRAVHAPLPLISAFTFKYACSVLPTKVIDLVSRAKASSTIVFSNLVGPMQPELFGGGTVKDIFFWMPIVHESMAISVGFISYNGGAHICLTGDVGCIPDRSRLDDLGVMMHEEITEICKV